MNDMSTALWITLLGMGLVFGAILLLWAMMILLVRVTPETESAEADSPQADSAPADLAQAVAAAVAAALAEQSLSSARPLKLPETTLVSAWQLGMRMRQNSAQRRIRRR